jgi:DNA-binding transcriptional ArsR family regulator
MINNKEIENLSIEFQKSQKALNALGDVNRQHLILVMMTSGQCSGMRVNDISAKTNLSRPAVSHHLKILKDANIVKIRKEGTKNYYYFDADMDSFNQLLAMLNHAMKIMESLRGQRQND